MGKLDAAERKRIPKSKFGLPGGRYPVENRSHAVDAKARATEEWEKGKLSGSQRKEIFAKADAELRDSKRKRRR